ARGIAESQSERRRRLLLVMSIATNLGILGYFKYFNFFNDVMGSPLPRMRFLLPVGISFYTFQSMSYTIDVFRRRVQPERHLGQFALYVSYFPQLVAGPIERAGNLIPQLRRMPDLRWHNAAFGFQQMLIGFFKKVVIADRLAPLVNTVYAAPEAFEGPQLALATVFFAIQIYCDFSGYSDIAIGIARIFGIRIMRNFDRPYLSKSISEFWSRWHISLSTWFRDYVYIPLGGNRRGPGRVYLNVLVTFLLSGLWHGANWTFIVWGAYHGVLLMGERFVGRLRSGTVQTPGLMQKMLQGALTFGLVLVGWVFFRADTIQDAWSVLTRIHLGWLSLNPVADFADLGLTKTFFLWSIMLIIGLFTVHFFERRRNLPAMLVRRPFLAMAFSQLLIVGILVMGVMGDESQFIYFQF
ncbi:MAG: MBOAT family O-acyltransferase, partial [Alkalispirochaeta sp.]